jgi:hypothetical protein
MTVIPSPTNLKIASIGEGSREWARKLMFDRALCSNLEGEVMLYDLDLAFQSLINDPSIHLPIDSPWELFKAVVQPSRKFLSLPAIANNRVQNAYTQAK